jgi:hypothetical protein
MTRADFGRHYHYLIFKIACHERKGMAFQKFFEQIMGKHDSSFIAVKPAGRAGDWKCDGFSQGTGTVYQCYAPDGIKIAEAVKKIDDDFNGARKFWEHEMREWVFVWSAYDALPPQVVNALATLKNGDHGVSIQDWSRDWLWDIVKSLTEEIRSELLLATVPDPTTVPDTTSAEIKVLLDFIAKKELSHDSENLDLTDITLKLERNRLTDSVKVLLTPAIPVAHLVENYLKLHPDSEYSAGIAQALAAEYNRITATGSVEPDDVFIRLVQYVTSHETTGNAKSFWAGTGIVTYYFQLCDIFDR